jgi:hypothetical protein
VPVAVVAMENDAALIDPDRQAADALFFPEV